MIPKVLLPSIIVDPYKQVWAPSLLSFPAPSEPKNMNSDMLQELTVGIAHSSLDWLVLEAELSEATVAGPQEQDQSNS